MKPLCVLLGVTLLALLSGCATVEEPQATGGSRSDGVIDLSFEYGMFQKPVVKWDDALQRAQQRCEAWGYSDAERFGGVRTQCESENAYGDCLRTLVIIPYQCTGNPNSQNTQMAKPGVSD